MGTAVLWGRLEYMETGTGPPWPPHTLHHKVDDAAGDAKAVGSHAVVGTLVAHMGTGDGDD